MSILKIQFISSAAMAVAATTVFAQNQLLDAPEMAIQYARTDIANIATELRAADASLDTLSSNSKKQTSADLFVRAKDNFLKGNYQLTINQLQTYLSLTQVPDPKLHLDAQFMIAFAHERTGVNDRAIAAYLRYIEVQTTASLEDKDRLIESFRRIFQLLDSDVTVNETDRRKIFSALTSLKLEPKEKAELLLYGASGASKITTDRQREGWLLDALSLAGDEPTLVGQINYQLAGIYQRTMQVERAKDILTKIKSDIEKTPSDLRDLATLSLARINFKSGNSKLAAELYKLIPAKSPYFGPSLFEQVFAFAESSQHPEALSAAKTYLSKFSNKPEAITISAYLALLETEAKNPNEAKQILEKAVGKLTRIMTQIDAQMSSPRGLDGDFLKELRSLKLFELNPNGIANYVIKRSDAVKVLSSQMGEIEHALYAQTFALDQMGPFDINPDWRIRTNNLNQITMKSLLSASKIIASASNLLAGSMTPAQKSLLAASARQRQDLLGDVEGLRRKRSTWTTWKNFLELSKSLNQSIAKITQSRADIATINYNIDESSQQPTSTTDEISLYKKSLETYRNFVATRLRSSAKSARTQEDEALLQQYRSKLQNEFAIIESAMDTNQNPSLRYSKSDVRLAWREWLALVDDISGAYLALNNDMSLHLEAVAIDLMELYERHNRQSDLLELAKSDLNRIIRVRSKEIYSEVSTTTSNQLSRYRKWLSDLNWIKTKELEQEKANLRDNLAAQLIDIQFDSSKTGVRNL